MKIIITYRPEAGDIVQTELMSTEKSARLKEPIAPGICLAELGLPKDELYKRWKENPPIFIRHAFPLDLTLELSGLPPLEAAEKCAALSQERGACVQVRALPGVPEGFLKHEFCDAISSRLPSIDRARILSVLVSPGRLYAGISSPEENLSRHSGGKPWFPEGYGLISRAEYKLLEAAEHFNIPLLAKSGLDLGAAPGGWTRVMRLCGCESVTAVDPSRLNPAIENDPCIIHVPTLAEDFLNDASKFDLIVNDMKLDANRSCSLMNIAASHLHEGGYGVITLKLAQGGALSKTRAALSQLSKEYKIIGARQLYYNRSEVTVALSR